jgi:hypothetical protein
MTLFCIRTTKVTTGTGHPRLTHRGAREALATRIKARIADLDPRTAA